MAHKKETKCNQNAMVGFYLMLADMVQNLNTAYEAAQSAFVIFDEGYEGDAKEEVNIFLANLPLHIYRLEIFYSKLMEFIAVTAESLLRNDEAMTRNMEK